MDKKAIVAALKDYSDTPELDVRFFLEDCPNPTDAQVADFIRRRQSGEPVAKILGHCGFWNLDFLVSTDTLDPRPDSETLIEAVLEFYPDKSREYSILDLGTGSGCLLLTLLSNYKNAQGVGIDFSDSALQMARKNADRLNIPANFEQRDFMQPNWMKGLEKFDIIVSNPPYIPSDDIAGLGKSVRCFDPLTALDGGLDGLDAYRALADSIESVLAPNGLVFFEIGQGQEQSVCALMEKTGFRCIKACSDLGHIIRILVFQKA